MIITRKRIKNMYIRLDETGHVRVSAPLSMSDQQIHDFVDSKSAWIAEKRQQLNQRQTLTQNTDEQLWLWGQQYPIQYHANQSKTHIVLENDCCQFYSRTQPSLEQRENSVLAFYRLQLMAAVHHDVAHYEPVLGVNVSEVRSKVMKSRWGTCNIEKRRLWFSVHLAKYPRQCAEYVVVHEMAHLLERYHNRRFYGLVESAMPDWRRWHDYLKRPS